MTIIGSARLTSCHSFRLIMARPRKMDRQMFPRAPISPMGIFTPRASCTLRMMAPTIMAPM